MKQVIKLLVSLVKRKPGFRGTPEAFLAIIIEMQSRNSKVYSEKEVLQFGDVMMKVFKVNLSPYRDFADLLKNGNPDEALLMKIREETEQTNKRIELKKAIYGENADLGDDDIMKRNDRGSIFARRVIKDMSEYVRFHEDDQKSIDEF
jgi:hypothetical protein